MNKETKVLDHGFVRLVDYMGNDESIVNAARVSYGAGTKKVNDDRNLIRYLMRNQHTTPFEMVEISLHIKCPIFVARQWMRHRTASYNEYSGRYSIMSDDFYLPDVERINVQSKDNKQGTSTEDGFSKPAREDLQSFMKEEQETANEMYQYYIQQDLARELSRINLPVSNYTEFYVKVDLLNLMKFIKLRMDNHAQYEIRVYAEAIYEMVKEIAPIATEAFEDYVLNSVSISAAEMRVIKRALDMEKLDDRTLKVYVERADELGKREKKELMYKLGLE